MIEEILPNLYRTEIPLPKSPLKWLNSYIVKGEDRFLIIDTGFNREECLNAMNASLQKLGVDLNKTDIFITHLHVGPHGACRVHLPRTTPKSTSMSRKRSGYMPKYDNRNHWQKILDVYIANGFAAEGARTSMESHPAHKYGLKRKIDFTIVKEVT